MSEKDQEPVPDWFREELKRVAAETDRQWKALRSLQDVVVENRTELRQLRDEVHGYRSEARQDHNKVIERIDALGTNLQKGGNGYRLRFELASSAARALAWFIGIAFTGIVLLLTWFSMTGGIGS